MSLVCRNTTLIKSTTSASQDGVALSETPIICGAWLMLLNESEQIVTAILGLASLLKAWLWLARPE